MLRWGVMTAFIGTIPVANWMIWNVGTCGPNGPCVIPVWPSIMAPSGVLMIGAALVLRDLVHRALGWRWAVGGILTGAALSFTLAPPSLALASGAAFLLSEMADLLVYAPLYRRRLLTAVATSSLVGAIIDSAVFLSLAFGSLTFLPGQVIGKAWMVLLALPLIYLSKRINI